MFLGMRLFRRFQTAALDTKRLIHGLKTAIAFLIGMVILSISHLPCQGVWVLLSLLIVMCSQSRVGAIVNKSYMRFLGTLTGACVAALTLTLAHSNPLWTVLIICVAVAVFSYIADGHSYWSEAGPVGAITVAVILVGPEPNYTTVLCRFFEISLGILIALVVSRFVWPLRSRTQLRHLLRATLGELQKLSEQLKHWGSAETEAAYEDYEDKIVARFATQNKLYTEAGHESFDRSSLRLTFPEIARSEREILSNLSLLKYVLKYSSGEMILRFNRQPYVQKFYEGVQGCFDFLIDQMDMHKDQQVLSYACDFFDWKDRLQQEFKPMTSINADKLAIDLFIFAASRLLVQLGVMSALITKL